jgi:hypothetical protein
MIKVVVLIVVLYHVYTVYDIMLYDNHNHTTVLSIESGAEC